MYMNDGKLYQNIEKKLERGPVLPSGSCFDTIALEIGVNFTEDKKYKTGGKDFFRKFNKYSHETYIKQLKNNQNSNAIINNSAYKTQYNLTTNDYANSNNTNTSNLAGANYTSSPTYSHNKEINSLVNTTNQFLKMSQMNKSAYDPNLKVSQNMMSLRFQMNNLDLITEGEERAMMAKNNPQSDIFKEKNKEKANGRILNKKAELVEMNRFASTILSNDQWGSNQRNKSDHKFSGMKSYKPNMKEIEKEMGMSIFRKGKKLPRERNHNLYVEISSSLDTIGRK